MNPQEGRAREFNQKFQEERAVGSLVSVYETLGKSTVQIDYEPSDPDRELKRRAVVDGVKQVQLRGFQLPGKIRFVLSSAPTVRCIAYMVSGQPVVFLGPKIGQKNPAGPHNPGVAGGLGKEGPRGIAHQEYDAAWRGLGNPKTQAQASTTVIHELGHILHEQQSASRFWQIHDEDHLARGVAIVATEVSHYATKGPTEFVAEVFAGTISGRRYSDGVKNAYRDLGGPDTRGFMT